MTASSANQIWTQKTSVCYGRGGPGLDACIVRLYAQQQRWQTTQHHAPKDVVGSALSILAVIAAGTVTSKDLVPLDVLVMLQTEQATITARQ